MTERGRPIRSETMRPTNQVPATPSALKHAQKAGEKLAKALPKGKF